MDNDDVIGAAQAGDAPTTSEWSTIYLPIKVQLILETVIIYGIGLVLNWQQAFSIARDIQITDRRLCRQVLISYSTNGNLNAFYWKETFEYNI